MSFNQTCFNVLKVRRAPGWSAEREFLKNMFCNNVAIVYLLMAISYKGRLDALSVGLSFVCLLHCVLLPAMIAALPFFGIELLRNPYVELLLLLLALPVGGMAILKSYRLFHKKDALLWLFAAGAVAMISGNVLSDAMEPVLKISGAALIVAAHVGNWKLSKTATVCCAQ
jgi:hypothetical protein